MLGVGLEIISLHSEIESHNVMGLSTMMACWSNAETNLATHQMLLWDKEVLWTLMSSKMNHTILWSWLKSCTIWTQILTNKLTTTCQEFWKKEEFFGSKHAHLNSKLKDFGGPLSFHKVLLLAQANSQVSHFLNINSRQLALRTSRLTSHQSHWCLLMITKTSMVL